MSEQRIALGIDIGGTKVYAGLMREDGTLVRAERFAMRLAPIRSFAADLCQHLDVLLDGFDESSRVKGIGIGVKGHIDHIGNRILRSSTLILDPAFDLGRELSERYALPVMVENDVNAATMAECLLGAGRESRDFVYINIGTGTAVGIVADGHLIRGRRNYAGEIGLTLMRRKEGEPPLYRMEDVASGKGMDAELRRLTGKHPGSVLIERLQGPGRVPVQEIFDACRAGDDLASEVVENALEAVTLTVVSLETMLDAGLYVFGGGLMSDGWFFEKVKNAIDRCAKAADLNWTAKLTLSSLGAAEAGLLGAACVALFKG